ncbi:MAG: ATP-dependent zinc protease [Candidatus Diapherotrites archaeon]|nr:ATP-dependent zinc protease [Candidatus Diapherotrites archaeon]
MSEFLCAIGLTEEVIIKSQKKSIKTVAKIDTGATRSSIDKNIVFELEAENEPRKRVRVKSALGEEKRRLVRLEIDLCGKSIMSTFSISDRLDHEHHVLIGRDVLFGNFVVDVSKKHLSFKLNDLKVKK